MKYTPLEFDRALETWHYSSRVIPGTSAHRITLLMRLLSKLLGADTFLNYR
jgi:hypothetical protein